MDRMVYFILDNHKTDDGEFTPLIAIEGETGYHATDWAWGKNRKIAQQLCDGRNARAGISENDVQKIICGTMRKGS